MKLVKLLEKPISAVAGIVGIPNAETITTDQTLLVSDDRYKLLKFNHVKMLVIKEFSEVAVAGLGEFKKDFTYVLKGFIDPKEIDSFDPSEYEIGDYLFVYVEPKDETTGKTLKDPGPKPKMPKPEPGFVFTPQEWAEIKMQYDADLAEWEEAKEAYDTAIKKFIREVAELPEYGWLIRVVSDTQYKVISDFSFETTKDERQFGVLGKLPKEVATKITKALGDLAEDESIKGLTIAEILTRALGLEKEEDVIGLLKPED